MASSLILLATAAESAAARICTEAGGRATTNMFIRDLDVAVPNALDGRRLEVVADGLPLFGGAQLAVDATLVSPLHADGSPHRHAADMDGAVLTTARRKERTYHSPRNQFERFRGFLELIARFEFDFRRRGNYFSERFEFLVCSKFNDTQCGRTCACAVACLCLHRIPVRMLWCL